MDLAFVLLTVVFFAASFWFVRACDALDPAGGAKAFAPGSDHLPAREEKR